MILELIEPEDFEDLPSEAGPRWVALEKITRTRLSSALETNDHGRSAQGLKLQYMRVVSTAANELGIEGIGVPPGQDPSVRLDNFLIDVQAAVTRVSLNASDSAPIFGFRVRNEAKDRIRDLVLEIQRTIPQLQLTPNSERRLKTSLQNFSQELDNPKSRFSIGSGHLVAAMTVLNLVVTTTAAGPDALASIEKIQTIWGEEKERSESQTLRVPYEEPHGLLAPPPKQLPRPSHNSDEA
ncbi:hypothetical protein GG681_06770 [Epibacterium sp. SM1969]|uniref:Uncharacterized protein n=1 Tax=Tritonibacter aquimaris TaxID=2663379 RepID=A0A844ALB7_9RHOB|nr:hypothetical protein [Tritonibacter aquimaris]MQY42339.1 hypothetical protein [Tritonibacter aquimaris]